MQLTDQQVDGRQVVKINTTEEIVYPMKELNHSRVFHACQMLNSNVVLVSGGLTRKGGDPSEVLPDMLYNTTSQEVIKVLSPEQSLGRIQHSMIRIGDRVLALGGRDSNNRAPSKIAEFNTTTNTWIELSQELQSTNTSELIVTAYPASSLDCVPDCECGIVHRKGRIFGGVEAEVRNIFPVIVKWNQISRKILTPGLPHF